MTNYGIRIATLNANSIRSRLEIVLAWMAKTQTDVLCVQETKVQDHDFPVQPIRDAGFHVAFRGQKAHAGVAVISRFEPEDVRYGLDDVAPDDPSRDEARLISVRIEGIRIVNTYVPEGRSIDHEMFAYKLAWFERLKAYLRRHHSPSEELLWAGDINVAPAPIDVYDPRRLVDTVDFHPSAREAFARTCEWGLVDLLRLHHPDEPGHYSYFDYRLPNALNRNLGWRIDHLLATVPLASRCTGCWIDVEPRRAERPSDHTCVVADIAPRLA